MWVQGFLGGSRYLDVPYLDAILILALSGGLTIAIQKVIFGEEEK